jgi:hypothetical protein
VNSTLIGQSPARESAAKFCVVCKVVEGTLKKSGVVVFDVNQKTGKKYAKCRKCKAYADEISNPKTNQKVRPFIPALYPMTFSALLYAISQRKGGISLSSF